jgi:hypothetical protein
LSQVFAGVAAGNCKRALRKAGKVGSAGRYRGRAEKRGLSTDSPHLGSLVDYMEVAGWIEKKAAWGYCAKA